MKGRTKKNILLIFFSIAVIAAVGGFLLWNKPHQNIKDAGAIKTNAVNLYHVFITDSLKAKTMYLNKVVVVSGTVKQVSTNQQNQQLILLNTSVPYGSVNCTMEENASNPKANDSILLKGICAGYMGGDMEMGLPGDVFLIRCYPSN